MNKFLVKLLGKQILTNEGSIKPIIETLQSSPNDSESNEAIPSQDIFADYKPPISYNPNDIKLEKPVKVFLDHNYEQKGRVAGFESHAHDMLPIYKAELQSSFRASLELMIQLTEIDLLGIRTQLNEVGDAIPSIKQNLELRIQLIQSNIEEMRMQKILSVDDEGWIAPVIQSFTKGFRLGMFDYFQEKSFTDFSVI